MKMELYDEGRYLKCKYGGCGKPIRILSRTLLARESHLGLKVADIPHTFLACKSCGHVYGYTPLDIHPAGAGHTLGQDQETVPGLGRVEFPCAFQSCSAHMSILVPTSADNSSELHAEIEKLEIGEVLCRYGHVAKSIPEDRVVSFDRSDWGFP